MTIYYTRDEKGNINARAEFKFEENCFATEENLVHIDTDVDEDNLVMLESEYKEFITTQTYTDMMLRLKRKNKISENEYKCKDRFTQGITYQNIMFDCDDTAKSNLLLTLQILSEDESVSYLDYNCNTVNLNKNELSELARNIIKLTRDIYVYRKQKEQEILNISTLEELEELEINYSNL